MGTNKIAMLMSASNIMCSLNFSEDPNLNGENYNNYRYCYDYLCVCHCLLLVVYVCIITPNNTRVNRRVVVCIQQRKTPILLQTGASH